MPAVKTTATSTIDMKKMLNIGSMKWPQESATKGYGFIGKRGSGKSYGAAVFAEEMFDTTIPFVVFDPIDVWWGLKVAADGKSKGLPVVVFGRDHADIQLNRTMGKKIAEAVVRHNISCVISTFGLNKTEMREIIADFSERLLQLNNTPRQVIIEEAHEFVPQRVGGAMARCFSAVEALLVMGRNRGIGVSLLNQRMATLNKDLLTQIDVLVAFRSVGPQDRKAFKDWVQVHGIDIDETDVILKGDRMKFDEFMRSVPSLPTGTAWVWSPEFLECFEKVTFRKRRTFHPDREKLGMTFKMPTIQQGDVQSFIETFNKRPEPKPGHISMAAADRALRSLSAPGKAAAVEKRVADPMSVPGVRALLAQEYKRGSGEGVEAGRVAGAMAAHKANQITMSKLRRALLRVHGDVSMALALLDGDVPVIKFERAAGVRVSPPAVRPPAAPSAALVSGELKPLVGKGVLMLQTLATKYPMKFTRSQLSLQVKMSASGGGFQNYVSILKANGWATEEEGFLQGTEAGIEQAGVTPDAPGTPEERREMWRGKLVGKGKEMFDAICGEHPDEIALDELAYRVSMAVDGGGFQNYLATMRTNGLVKVDYRTRTVRASDDLFKV